MARSGVGSTIRGLAEPLGHGPAVRTLAQARDDPTEAAAEAQPLRLAERARGRAGPRAARAGGGVDQARELEREPPRPPRDSRGDGERDLPGPAPLPQRFRQRRDADRRPALAARRDRLRGVAHGSERALGRGGEGLLPLMPATARELRLDGDDPATNVLAGARYLRQMIDRFGSIDLALAAYNAGPNAVERAGGAPTTGTLRYVKNIESRALRLAGC